MEARLAFMGHALMDKRLSQFVDACVTRAYGHAERDAALAMIEPLGDRPRSITLGAVHGYAAEDLMNELRSMNVRPHMKQNLERWRGRRPARHHRRDVFDRNSTVDNLIIGDDDIISGGAGDDDLFGEVAFGDALTGVSGGNDVMSGGDGNDEVRGQTGDDLIDGGAGTDTLDGGAGGDTLTYATAAAGVAVNLLVVGAQNTIAAGLDSILGFENLDGSRYNDTFRGDAASNEIFGGRGADQLFSGGGQDNLTAGSGNDTLNTVAQAKRRGDGQGRRRHLRIERRRQSP